MVGLKAARHLHPVDMTTGEVVKEHSYDDLLTINTKLRHKFDGAMLENDRLQKELANFQGQELDAPAVTEVLEWWRVATASVREGRAKTARLKANIAPGSERFKKAKARLKEAKAERTEQEAIDHLRLACTGATLDDFLQKNSNGKRYDDITTIFKHGPKVDELAELAMNEDWISERQQRTIEVPENFPLLWAKQLFKSCDCSHLLLSHADPDPDKQGWRPCQVEGCDCPDWTDVIQQIESWKRDKGLAA